MNADDRAELRGIRDQALAAVRDLRTIADAYRHGAEAAAARAIAADLDRDIADSADPLVGDERPGGSAPMSDPAANPRPRARTVRDELGRLAQRTHRLSGRLDEAQDRAFADLVVLDGALFAALRRINEAVVHDDRYEGLIE